MAWFEGHGWLDTLLPTACNTISVLVIFLSALLGSDDKIVSIFRWHTVLSDYSIWTYPAFGHDYVLLSIMQCKFIGTRERYCWFWSLAVSSLYTAQMLPALYKITAFDILSAAYSWIQVKGINNCSVKRQSHPYHPITLPGQMLQREFLIKVEKLLRSKRQDSSHAIYCVNCV